jgi:hypothetical protein
VLDQSNLGIRTDYIEKVSAKSVVFKLWHTEFFETVRENILTFQFQIVHICVLKVKISRLNGINKSSSGNTAKGLNCVARYLFSVRMKYNTFNCDFTVTSGGVQTCSCVLKVIMAIWMRNCSMKGGHECDEEKCVQEMDFMK